MNRRGFLTRALGAIGAVALGRYAGAGAPAMPTAVPATVGGSFVFLDQGALELGIMRDAILRDVPGGDFALFCESFENAALVDEPVHVAAAV